MFSRCFHWYQARLSAGGFCGYNDGINRVFTRSLFVTRWSAPYLCTITALVLLTALLSVPAQGAIQQQKIRASNGLVYQISFDSENNAPASFSVRDASGTAIIPSEEVAVELYLAARDLNALFFLKSVPKKDLEIREDAREYISLIRSGYLKLSILQGLVEAAIQVTAAFFTAGTSTPDAVISFAGLAAKTDIKDRRITSAQLVIEKMYLREFAAYDEFSEFTRAVSPNTVISTMEIKSARINFARYPEWNIRANMFWNEYIPALPEIGSEFVVNLALGQIPIISEAITVVELSVDIVWLYVQSLNSFFDK